MQLAVLGYARSSKNSTLEFQAALQRVRLSQNLASVGATVFACGIRGSFHTRSFPSKDHNMRRIQHGSLVLAAYWEGPST